MILYGIGWTVFLLPNDLPSGAVPGIASIVYWGTGLPVQYTYFAINGFLLLLSLKILGWKFSVKTIFAVFVLTFFLSVIQQLTAGLQLLQDQPFMACILGAIFCGGGIGVAFASNGSTGGTDIVAAIVNKYRDVSLGRMVMLCDMIIIASSYFVLHDLENALRDVNFRVEKGEFCCIVGQSGSGKSTLLNQLAGLEKPTRGKVFIGKHEISAMTENELAAFRQAHLGFIFQSYNLLPSMTAAENVALPLMFKGMGRKQRLALAKQELKSMGLSSRVNHLPTEMSGGQQQRVGIARALAVKPEFIVCDEPISALDVSIQSQVVNMLEDMQQELGLTYLFIAHDLSVVRHISNRIGVMYLGKLVELADSFELIAHSIHPYTRSLISAIPVADPITARQSKRIVLQGDVPSPLNPPSGCRFRTRCPYADERCAAEVPEFKEVTSGHWAACHHLDKVK